MPQYLFYPSIDPLSEKNRELEPGIVENTLRRFQIDPLRPIITQISRFDRLKDPVGVVRAYLIVKRYTDCQLVLAGGGATDDPEGDAVLAEVRETAGKDPDIHILDLPPWSAVEINALQRASTVIVQKSLREGFGLTVTEGLWKKKPVVASAVGGIPSQVIHKHTGMLAHSIEGTAYQIRFLLSNPAIAQRLGERARTRPRAFPAHERCAAAPDSVSALLEISLDRPAWVAFLKQSVVASRFVFLAMPISWRGTLQQYVGRLHRLHENKKEVIVYDYSDLLVPMLARMYKKRLAGYTALGYIVAEGPRT